ncbi:hypothetical protein [Actinokineospora iranica]|uniref:Uncharacterized protein n=1 Tax=Actinokineospora iranica TaxID=1271860 RepID=A0A1G6T8U2_9PSEU|nr:hypothetical protein [Actinokineospora iranica]SDD25478.1 hypothetical protein SAMN05216174_10929 [Actinokineospora iranica]
MPSYDDTLLPAPRSAEPAYEPTAVPVDPASLAARIAHLTSWNADRLAAEGCLVDPPQPGGPMIGRRHRSPLGEDLLREAKDLLYTLLFGTREHGVALNRVQRELLILAVPLAKAPVLAFASLAPAESGDAAGNALLRIEYGETAGELVGDAVVAALRLINRLEINEGFLSARKENARRDTLI